MSRVPLRQRRKADFESLWLVTFADLMVQLMAFFAVVYSYSQLDQSRLKELLGQFQKAVGLKVQGIGPGSSLIGAQTPGPQPEGTGAEAARPGDGPLPGTTGLMPDRVSDLEKLLNDLRAADGPDVGTRLRVVSFRGAVLFPEGSAAVDPAFETILDRIAQLTVEYPGFSLVVEGHAAPEERNRPGGDALEVSAQRAMAVVRRLKAKGVDPQMLAAEARGEAYPEGDGSSPEGRALLRRVRFRFQRLAER